jgi:cardiolipin synthase
MRRWLPLLPNIVSVLRMLLVVPLAIALAHRQFAATLWLFGVAAASDALDGFLARRFGWQSELGGILDPLADKLMLATVFIMLAVSGDVPAWLTLAVLARDGIIVMGAIAFRVLVGKVKARPSVISKLNTLIQVLYILFVIGAREFTWPAPVGLVLGALVFVTVSISGIDYVLVYGRMAVAQSRSRPGIDGAGQSKPA